MSHFESARAGDLETLPARAEMRHHAPWPDRRLATGQRKVRLYASRMLESRKSRVRLPFRARDVIADLDLTRETRERRIMRTTKFGPNSKDGSHSRRDLIRGAALGGGAAAMLGGMGINPLIGAAMAKEAGMSAKPLKAAFSNAGLQATWCAQGKQAAEYWGKLFNVEVTWFDGELAAQKQRAG
jgi:hypothetical protein